MCRIRSPLAVGFATESEDQHPIDAITQPMTLAITRLLECERPGGGRYQESPKLIRNVGQKEVGTPFRLSGAQQ